MCGIVALLSPSPDSLADPLAAATRRLSHPGPDGAGSWISLDGCVALGHARLSIIDLETGGQLRSRMDAEILLHFCEEQSTECLEELRAPGTGEGLSSPFRPWRRSAKR